MANAYRMDAALSLLRFVATSGDKGSRSDFAECHMAITGGLEMPEGQLEVAGADVIQARRNKTVVEKRNVIDLVVRHAINASTTGAALIKDMREKDLLRYLLDKRC